MTEEMEAIEFAGSTLAPFFLNDPRKGDAGEAFAALGQLDVDAAAKEWPFVDEAQAAAAFDLMKAGLADGPDADELVWEYRRLFVGPGHLPVPPWGSVYTDVESVVFGESTLALRAFMRKEGVERTADERTPEDHIGLMLALMAYLAREKPESLDEFLSEHLLTWAPHYLDELGEESAHPFYEGLAQLTRATLEGIGRTRGLQVTLPRFYR
ncbi:Tat proofreading chaperone DmsD [Adlercreutzia aquisgranensis]|uniref:Tat proofreading chaperone DmsD n=1 Tax=Adlercreutzia aquisgranensis TaxID=2941323 RepID=UPI00203AB27A|nr:Tat proofreading chaperone DmsD [Adlercreutzia aquisgranensis]